MDPNTALADLLANVSLMQHHVDHGNLVPEALAETVAEGVDALDGWMRRAGALPDAWAVGRPVYPFTEPGDVVVVRPASDREASAALARTPRFTIDGSVNYVAVSYGPTWNGWVTPVVTRATYEAIMFNEDPEGVHVSLMFDAAGKSTHRNLSADHGGDDDAVVIAPDAAGNYDLAALGWTFSTVE